MNDDKAAIEATLRDYAAAYGAKDLERMMALFTTQGSLGGIGTGGDEYLFGRAQTRALFERNFADAEAVKIAWGEHHIELLGDAAWVQAKAVVSGLAAGRAFEVPLRWSIFLAREDGPWKWCHRHVSIAAGGQAAGDAYPSVYPSDTANDNS